jgi:5-methylcytosine-specific restriction protein A
MLMRLLRHVTDVSLGKTSIGLIRSSHWPNVEQTHRKLQPACVACGETQAINVHHIFPFHYCVSLGRPDLELDQRNLITLCETSKTRKTQDHHLLIGHMDNFKSSNLEVTEDASKTFKYMTADQIRANPLWLAKEVKKLKLLNDMSTQEKQDFTDLMNKTFPKLG